MATALLSAFQDSYAEKDTLYLEIDKSGIIIHASEACEKLTGFSRAEIEGFPLELLLSASMHQGQIDHMHRVLESGHPWHGNVFLSKKDGGLHPFDMVISETMKPNMIAIFRPSLHLGTVENEAHTQGRMAAFRLWFQNFPLHIKLQIIIQPVLLVILGLATFMVYHKFESDMQARVFNRASDIAMQVIDSANILMITGKIKNPEFRRLMIRKIMEGQNLLSLRLIRTLQVKRQYGSGLPEEQLDDPLVSRTIEQSLQAGYPIPYRGQDIREGKTFYRLIMPYFTSRDFRGTDCLSCHEVAQNTINGASDLMFDISNDIEQLHRTLWALLASQVFLQCMLALIVALILERFLRRPVANIQKHLDDIINGRYSRPADVSKRDEMGELLCAVQTTKLMMGSVTCRLQEQLRETLLEKRILERQSSIIEHIILTHERVTFWKDFVQEILKRFHDIFPFNIFFMIFLDGKTLHLSIYYLGFCSQQGREMTRKGIGNDARAKLGLPPDTKIDIEEFQVTEGADCIAIEDMNFITAAIPMDARSHLCGLLGVVYGQSKNLCGEEMRVIRSVLSVMVMVVGSSKALASSLRELEFYSTHDALTCLPNRNLLNDRITQYLHRAEREGESVAILFIDIDRFKNINDSLGHPIGDNVIRTIAERLLTLMRHEDTVARLGGDEFVVTISGVTSEDSVGAVALKLLSCIEEPITMDDLEFYLSASIGIAIYPMDGDSGEVLMKHADMAMYRAKREGGNTYRFYKRGMNEVLLARINLESRVRRALEHGELSLHYQPQVDLRTGRISGVEGLLRWESEGVLIPPMAFIPIIEETGFIFSVGEWALEQACAQAVAWKQAGITGLKVAVNVSMRQLWNKSFVNTVLKTLERTGCQPQWLELEITESVLMNNSAEAAGILNQLSERGILLTIDDFGTGYSSLSYLSRFPVHALKIDRSFVQKISSDANDAAIVHAVIELAHSLELEVVGEGIELASQHAFLINLRCDHGQGYYFSKPLPEKDVTALLLSGRTFGNNHELQHCQVRWLGTKFAQCVADPEHCRYARPPENFCEHPRVAEIKSYQ